MKKGMYRVLAVASMAALVVLTVGVMRYAAHATPKFNWGMYDTNYPSDMSRINSLNSQRRPAQIIQLGRPAQTVHWYREWSESCGSDPTYLQQQTRWGRTPFITWETYSGANNQNPYPLSQIAAGAFDSYIDSCANAFKKAGGTMLLRVDQEFNDPCCGNGGYPWTVVPGNQFGNTPQQYAQAYEHIVNRLRADGATNVQMVWNSDGDITDNPIPAGTYPGDAVVDYIGFDYYDFSSTPFQTDYNQIIKQSSTKPVLLGEMGADDGDGGASYVDDLTNSLTSGQAPRMYGAVWFNEGDLELSSSTNPNTFNAVKNLLASTSSSA
jgi:hypothetical protein